MSVGEIFVVTGSGQGHLQPCIELCKLLITRNYRTTLLIPSNISLSSVPSTFSSHAEVSIAQVPERPSMPGSDSTQEQAAQKLSSLILNRSGSGSGSPHVLCAIVDFQMPWTTEVFIESTIPVISFFTFGACGAALEWGAWKVQAGDIKPGETRPVVGLPDEMAITCLDIKRKALGPGGVPLGPSSKKPEHNKGGPGPKKGGPRKFGDCPLWANQTEKAVGLMFNTCDELERPFLSYMEAQTGIPAWGVGPLLPEQYWKSADSVVQDRAVRGQNRQSNYTEEEVIQWLDKKPRGSVLYIAFGTEVGPIDEEYPELASALEESTDPFIWAIPSKSREGYFPHGLDAKVGDRGLIIHGWAPQLLILSHPSTGGFLSHCGWNSTAEAVARGVPILAWPIRGDQYNNCKLVVNHLKVGYKVAEDMSGIVKKDDIKSGIERLMGDGEIHERTAGFKAKFQNGFPASSEVALDAFLEFVNKKRSINF